MSGYSLRLRVELERADGGLSPLSAGVSLTGELEDLRTIMSERTAITTMSNRLDGLLSQADDYENAVRNQAPVATPETSDGQKKTKVRKPGQDGAGVGEKPAGDVPAPGAPPAA